MAGPDITSSDELKQEIESLRAQLAEAQEVLRAIQAGDVDAVVVSGLKGQRQMFTLKGAEYDYRALVEAMNEGAATLAGDGTVLYCNQRLADLVGMPLEQIIGSHVTKFVSVEAMHDFEAMLERAWRGVSSTAELEFQAGRGKRIPVYLSLREMHSEDAALCMVVTDLTERKKVDELITAGKLAASILDSAAEAIAVCDETGRIVRANQALEVLCGASLLFQRFEAALPLKVFDGFTGAEIPFSISIALSGITLRAREALLRRDDGQSVSVLLTAAPIKSADGIVGCVVTMTDISGRKKSEEQLRKLNRALKAQSNSIQALLHAADEPGYLREVCRIVTEDCGHAMMWIGFAEDDKTVRPVAFSGFEDGYLENLKITWDDSYSGRGPTGSAIRTGRPTICRDMLTDPGFLPWRAKAVKRGYASSLVVPLMEGNSAFGAFSIYSREPNAFSIAEIGLLTELAADLAFGIRTLRLRSAHARSEAVITESEKRYRNLFNSMGEGFCIIEMLFDPDGNPEDYRFLQVNAAFEKQTGLRGAVGKRILELLPNNERHWFEVYGKVALSGEPISFISEARALGSWYDVHAYRVGAPEQRQVAIVFNDVSEHKRAEEILQRHADMQRLSFDAIIVWRLNRGIESWNQGAEQLYGYTESEAQGRVIHELLGTIRPVPLPEVLEILHESGNWEGELRHTTKDGREVTVTSRHQLMVGSDGVERILETNRDITDRKKAAQALLRSEKLASVGRMASTIAHEINNPLETIGNVLYLAMSDSGLPQEARSYLDIAVQELDRVTHITKQTLAFHRETSAPTLIDLSKSIDSTVRLYAGRLESRGVTIKKRCADVGRIKAFGGEIQQVISNLISNSMDATPDHGRIELRLSRMDGDGGDKIRLTIADTGSGIPPERLPNIFEPFFTTKEMYGTGLGLWVTKQIIEKHGAKIRVRSKLGRGTVFSIVFPVAEITEPR